MRIDGYWLTCDDGVSRPVVDAHVVGLNDAAFYERFLVDIGADRTVFSAHSRTQAGFTDRNDERNQGGRHRRRSWFRAGQNGDSGAFRQAFLDDTAIDLSVMGRDLLNHFDCIVSHRNAEVLLLAPNHRYVVTPG